MDWILCSDELPDKDDCYIVLWTDEKGMKPFYEIQEYIVDEGWQLDIPQASGEVEIIAWMKLPEIPKEIW